MPDPEITVSVVPWALPREPIPIRVSWAKKLRPTELRLTLPEGFAFVEAVHAGAVQFNGTSVKLQVISSRILDPNYIGAVIRFSAIPKELHHFSDVRIELQAEAQTIWEGRVRCNIFRPSIEVVGKDREFDLTDGMSKMTLPITIKYVGFGEVQVRIRSKIGGRLVSRNESVANELLRRLWESGALDVHRKSDSEEKKVRARRAVRLSPEYVEEMAAEVQRIIATGEMPDEYFDEQSKSEITAWFERFRENKIAKDSLQRTVQDLLIDILVDLFDRHPSQDVTLESAQTRVRARLKAPIEKLSIELHYTDLLNNEYSPATALVSVNDKRDRDRELAIDIPITVQGVEYKPFLDVVSMGTREKSDSAPAARRPR